MTLRNSYLWDNVCVESNCQVDTALLAHDVTVLDSVEVKRGVVLAANVSGYSLSAVLFCFNIPASAGVNVFSHNVVFR